METMTVLSTPVRVQDYILDTKVKKTRTADYHVVLQNNTDFVLARKTKRTQRELVILISQKLFYFREQDTGAVEPVTMSTLKSFLRDVDENIELDKVHWLPTLGKESWEQIMQVIEDDVLVDMCSHNMLGMPRSEYVSCRKYWVKNSKLYMQLAKIYPTITGMPKYRSSLSLVYEIWSCYGHNEAINFASQLVLSGIQEFEDCTYKRRYKQYDDPGFMGLVKHPQYNIQLRRFTDYILFDLYAQGYSKIPASFWQEYEDYLTLQISYYGKIVEKYPKYFKTMHDIVTLKYNNLKFANECKNFKERMAEVEDLAYKGKTYSIIVPQSPQDLVDEGVALSHCVKDYISRVSEGECHILFLRYTIAADTSLVTLQLSGGCICQAQGESRRAINAEEAKFLNRWAQDKGLKVAV